MSRSSRLAARVAGLLAVAGLALGGAAFAQESGGAAGAKPSAPGMAGQSAEDFSKQELQQFAQVQTEIRAIGERYKSKLSGAEGASDMQKLQQDMQKEMVKAVRSSGLDVGSYNSIARAAQGDPDLRKKIEGME